MSMGIIAGVIGAGASIYGASQAGGSGGAAPPPQMGPGKSLMAYLKGLNKGLPQLTQMEGEYRPQFGQLNIDDQTQYLTALLGLSGTANAAAGDQIQKAREKEFANMSANTGSVMGILGGLDPAGKAAADRANAMAETAYQKSIGPLSFEQRRGSDQQAREAFGARGRINDNISVAGEILGREDVRAANRAEATAANNTAFQLNQQFSSPALSMLLGVPASTSLGQDLLGASAGAIGANTPQFINPDAGINMGMQQNANLASYNQAQAAQKAGQAQVWGNLGSSLMGLGGTLYTNRN